eukprot:NODE_971_length_1067_cov_85.923379_g800_i0.p1 GENE.NODE_971_length_1067_cov_85.923379_g800_i0~~NODE_971_length_1067_cov_85.923379_g800_i0.p1  ORF type:complete len:184 (-),score=10.81 NODE_971_length_1067_cov_85.923379_g800_i0:357-908(-)
MGTKHSKGRSRDAAEIAFPSRFEAAEVAQIRRLHEDGIFAGELSEDAVKSICDTMGISSKLSPVLFKAQGDCNSQVSELSTILRGTVDERLDAIFRLLDTEDRVFLTEQELVTAAAGVLEAMGLPCETLTVGGVKAALQMLPGEQAVQHLLENNAGRSEDILTQETYKTTAKKLPVIMDALRS